MRTEKQLNIRESYLNVNIEEALEDFLEECNKNNVEASALCILQFIAVDELRQLKSAVCDLVSVVNNK